MSRHNDKTYLLNEQYRDASNLNARVSLHTRFSTNEYGWHRWVFEQFDLPENARILELGSGPGWLWYENAERIPPGWHIILSDFSPGMLMESQHQLSAIDHRFLWERIDAQAIPYPANTFDAVIANHMLYHVPDRALAIAEIYRVLKPGGTLFAATNGPGHLREITDLVSRFEGLSGFSLGRGARVSLSGIFTLEDGEPQISAHFDTVETRRYADALVVTEVEPFVAYILSGPLEQPPTDDLIHALRQFLSDEMQKTGSLDITKDSGLFVARKM